MYRRKIAMGLIGCLLAGMLAGCGIGRFGDAADPVSVRIWNYYNGKQKESFEQLVNRFNETVGEEKGIIVTAESKGNVNELAGAVLASVEKQVGADEVPDIFATYSDTALVLYKMGVLADIGQYFTEEELSEYVPAFLEEGELSEGEFYVLPIAKSTEQMFVNVTDWQIFARETGAKESSFQTWEGLKETAQQYYEWSGGKAFFGRDALANYLIVGSMQLGSPIFTVENGIAQITLDQDAMYRLWDCYAVPYLKGYYGAYGRFRSDDVKTGDLVACVGSTSSVTYYPTEVTREDGSTYPIEMEAYALPNFQGTESYAVQQGAGMAVIKSDEKIEQAACEFLKWFTAEEQNTEFSVQTGYFPVKTQAYQGERVYAALDQAEYAEDTLVAQSLLLSADAVTNIHLYASKPFDSSAEMRTVLQTALGGWLDAYRQQLLQLMADGMSEEEAWEAFLTDDLFEEWYNRLETELEEVMTGT